MSAAVITLTAASSFGTTVTTASMNLTAYSKFYVVVLFDTGAFTSLVDSQGNTYTQVGTETTSANGAKVRRYLCESATGSATHTWTLTIGTAGGVVIFPVALTGAQATALDQATTPNDDATTPYVSNNATTTVADEVLISAFCGESSSATATHAESTGFTIIPGYDLTDGTVNITCAMAYRNVTSTATYASSWTEAGGATSAGLVTLDTFKSLTTGLPVGGLASMGAGI